MQPQQQQPQYYGPPQPVQTGMPSGPNKKKPFIIGAIILVVIIIVASLLAMLGGNKKDNKNGNPALSDTSIYNFRDGYNVKEYGASIGDPMALDLSKNGKVYTSASGPYIAACNVLSISDINAQKTYVTTNSLPTPVKRSYLDGVGKQNVEYNEYTLPVSGEGENCTYALEKGGAVQVDVYQSAFVAKSAIDDQINRIYDATSSVNGLATYKRKAAKESANTVSYMLVSGNDAMELRLDTEHTSDTQRKNLLTTAAKNFVDLHANPKGAPLTAYTTPTFKKSYAKACDLITNDDIKTLTGSDASVFVQEALATGTGVNKAPDDKLYNSITNECTRSNTGLGSGLTPGAFDQEIDLTVTSYQSDAAAKLDIAAQVKDQTNKMSGSFGDEGYGYQDSAKQNTIVFRQGRFVVTVVFDRTLQKNANVQETPAMTQKLTPYAQQVAARLKQL
jgi:hypothetical protein